MSGEAARYSYREEIAHSIIHGVGIVLAIAALAILTGLSVLRGGPLHVVGCAIYGTTLILLYSASTLYHSIPIPHVKEVLRTLDHSAIFLLIAGTYTPFCLVTLEGVWGWSMFAAVWSLAVIGILLRVLRGRKSAKASVFVYILMGWLILVAFKPLLAHMSSAGMTYLVLGGLTYTLGVIFYVWRSLPYHHAIWHLFVLGGSIFHFFAILQSVIPTARV